MSIKPKVLYVVHGHPSLFPGGSETHALELYQAMRAAGECEPLLLARAAFDVRDSVPGDSHRAGFSGEYPGVVRPQLDWTTDVASLPADLALHV
jgi:hypothetical protein